MQVHFFHQWGYDNRIKLADGEILHNEGNFKKDKAKKYKKKNFITFF